jgi:hypothetical protein
MSRPRSRRRGSVAALTARVLVVAAVFVLGLAIGAALDDEPEPGTTTYERTLRFATVTVTQP